MEPGYSSLGVELGDETLSEIAIKEKINRRINRLASELSPQALKVVSERLKASEAGLIGKFAHSDEEALLEVEIAREVDSAIDQLRSGNG
ncbi:MAG: hypothetical protein CL582_17870 [Alteromonadaceae bacterium]|nr:hypothetical protein [Alteromonadaceae bacterium]|tara:strand:- start:77622 stop:77891 length:270 start_codon:yes stop_codon:yes gene_type:complete